MKSGALVGGDGKPGYRILTLGPLLKEETWGSTAARELRVQAIELARAVITMATRAAST